MIVQTAKLRIAEGKSDEFATAAKTMVAAVNENEKGRTLRYELYRSESDPNLFMFFETYADDAALAAHGSTPHMAEFGGKLRSGGLLAGRLELERFQQL